MSSKKEDLLKSVADLFDNYSSNTDAIRSLIFPGGMLPSPSKFIRYAQNNDLKVINKISFGKMSPISAS